jgi:hypothetical protein
MSEKLVELNPYPGDINAMTDMEYWQHKARENYDGLMLAIEEIGQLKALLREAWGNVRTLADRTVIPESAANRYALADRIEKACGGWR